MVLPLQNLNFVGHECAALQLPCGDEFGGCYPRAYRCDGVRHCRNGADESNCKYTHYVGINFMCRLYTKVQVSTLFTQPRAAKVQCCVNRIETELRYITDLHHGPCGHNNASLS